MGSFARSAVLAAMMAGCIAAPSANAQAPSPINIPLELLNVPASTTAPTFPPQWRLGINVGINGGAPQLYLFDTGSALFNAQYNQAWWPGFTPGTNPATGNTPAATVANGTGVTYCYGNGSTGCRGFQGNIVQANTLRFFTPSTAGTPHIHAATLNASPGYQINAVYNSLYDSTTTLVAGTAAPMLENTFYGVFGAGDFTSQLTNSTAGSYTAGSILGQTTVSAAAQGYVVAANGQVNPVSSVANPPQQANGQNVVLGGVRQAVTTCSPCVSLGLTPQLLGQFAPIGMPATSNLAGLVPWINPGTATAFPNPYGGTTGNNSSAEMGVRFNVTLTAADGSFASTTNASLLDTGTGGLTLSTDLRDKPGVSNDTSVYGGVTLSATGVTSDGSSISGLPTSKSVLQAYPADPITYTALFDQRTPGTTNTLGLSFFLQNSVLFDLSDQAVGYTPYFVTDAKLSTAASPLIVDGTNLPLGLAGVISGSGGVQINGGGNVQLSATNTYTGQTVIATGGQLSVAGPGSIARSQGVQNDGLVDISRAWGSVAVRSLSGTGRVTLGGQHLDITNANGKFSGVIADGGGGYPGVGGSLSISGGTQILSGTNIYTGATTVSGGQLMLTGSVTSDVTVGAAGLLSGTGLIFGNLINAGMVAPGLPGNTLTVGVSYGQAAGASQYTQVDAAGQASRLFVGGAATLLGGTVLVGAAPGTYGMRTTYTILSAAGGVAGTFSSAVSSHPFLVPSLSYDANDVYLTLQVGGFSAAAQTPAQAAVAGALDRSAPTATGDFASVLSALASMSPAQVSPVLTSLSGQNYSGFSSAMVQNAQLFMSTFSSQASRSRGGTARVALAEACDAPCDSTEASKWAAWGGGLGGTGVIGAGSNSGTVTYTTGGFAAGLERQFSPAFSGGITAGFTSGTQWVGGFSGQGLSNTILAGLYGNYAEGPLHLDGLVGYAYSANQLSRSIVVPGLQPRVALGQTGANQFYGQLEGGYRWELGGPSDASLTPFAQVRAYTGTQNAFTESGAQSLNLAIAAQTTNSLRSVLGAQITGAMDLGWKDKLRAQLRLAWSHEYADTSRPVSASFAGAPTVPFTTLGATPQRDAAVIGVAASTAITEGTSLYIRYEGDISQQDSSHALTAGLRLTW